MNGISQEEDTYIGDQGERLVRKNERSSMTGRKFVRA